MIHTTRGFRPDQDKDAEIASLKAENAELKKRLAKFEADRMPFEQQTCGRRK